MPIPMSPEKLLSENYKKGLYKTEICRTWIENHGKCKYGDRCQYAHGQADLREVPRHPKYKTVPCKAYYETGLCPYGIRCTFLHDEHQELVNFATSFQTMNSMLPNNMFHLQHDTLSGFNPNATIFTPQKMNNEDKELLYAEPHCTKDGSFERLLNDSGFALSESEIEPFIGNGFTDAKAFIEKQEQNCCDAFDDQSKVIPNFNCTDISLHNRYESGRLPIFHKFSSNNNNNRNQ